MGFFVRKSVVLCFLLQILLLTYSSHANSHLPQVREGDRKLLGWLRTLFKRPKPVGVTRPHFDLPLNKPTVPDLNKPSGPVKPSRNEVKPTDSTKPSVKEAFCKLLANRTENALKKMGETNGREVVWNNGTEGFRAGLIAGKIYLAMEKKCQEYQNDFNCTTSCATKNCVLQVAEATGNVSCSENCYLQPAQFPCSFSDVVASAISNNQVP